MNPNVGEELPPKAAGFLPFSLPGGGLHHRENLIFPNSGFDIGLAVANDGKRAVLLLPQNPVEHISAVFPPVQHHIAALKGPPGLCEHYAVPPRRQKRRHAAAGDGQGQLIDGFKQCPVFFQQQPRVYGFLYSLHGTSSRTVPSATR